jgi:serine/threonine protein kinase
MSTPDSSTPPPQDASPRRVQFWKDRDRRAGPLSERQGPSLARLASREHLVPFFRVTRVSSKYAIERRLGGGGMGEVFLARAKGAEGFTRWVALKRVLPGLSENPGFARMFVAEALLSSRLQHPNLVSVLDFDRGKDGRLFLVMELVDGVDLGRLLETGPLSTPLIIYLAIEILSGLSYAHDLPREDEQAIRGIVHRDISPHNILLSWEGAVKIADFGLAKSRAASHVSPSGIVRGKPAYMSPEQATLGPLDGRSDLFGVGVMLWEMLCQRPLFRGATAQETTARMLFAPIPSPSEVRPDVPEDLSRVVLRLLVRDRTQRTPNAGAAITELVACADHARNGRGVLIQTLAERFAGCTVAHVHGVGRCSPMLPGQGGVRRPASAKPADGGPSTPTAPPGVVLDPVAPPRSRRRRSRR